MHLVDRLELLNLSVELVQGFLVLLFDPVIVFLFLYEELVLNSDLCHLVLCVFPLKTIAALCLVLLFLLLPILSVHLVELLHLAVHPSFVFVMELAICFLSLLSQLNLLLILSNFKLQLCIGLLQ